MIDYAEMDAPGMRSDWCVTESWLIVTGVADRDWRDWLRIPQRNTTVHVFMFAIGIMGVAQLA